MTDKEQYGLIVIVIGVITFAVQKWLEYKLKRRSDAEAANFKLWADEQLELQKADLVRSNTLELDRYKLQMNSQLEMAKSELQRDSLEHEVRYRALHEKLSEALAKAFGLIETIHALNHSLGRPLSLEIMTEEEAIKEEKAIFGQWLRTVAECSDYLRTGFIYLPYEVSELMNCYLANMVKVAKFTIHEKNADKRRASHLESGQTLQPMILAIHAVVQRLLGFKLTEHQEKQLKDGIEVAAQIGPYESTQAKNDE